MTPKERKEMLKRREKEEKRRNFYPGALYKSFRRFPKNLIFMYNMKMNSHRRYLINMRLRNGDEHMFYAFPKEGVFEYEKGLYIVDDSLARFNIAANIYVLNYHEDLCLPIKFDYDVAKLKDMVSDPNVSDMRAALNPVTLENSQRSKVVQNMMTGAGIPEMMRRIMMITVVTLIVVGAMTLLLMWKFGLFEAVTGAL